MNDIKNSCGFLVTMIGIGIGMIAGFRPFEFLVVGFLCGLFVLAMDWE